MTKFFPEPDYERQRFLRIEAQADRDYWRKRAERAEAKLAVRGPDSAHKNADAYEAGKRLSPKSDASGQ